VLSTHIEVSELGSTGLRPTAGPPAPSWESRYRRAVVLADLVLIAICLRVGLVLTDGSLSGHLPGALAGMTAIVLFGSLVGCRVWEQRMVELVVTPALMEITGPRLHVAPVYGQTMLRVSLPTFHGVRWVLKSALDRVSACFALFLLAPLLLAVALAVKLEDRGPVFFWQQRVGKAGRRFWMVKFRSMVIDAERQRFELELANEGSGPLFKLRTDPRVTRVGAVLRHYSLDELPQFINVVIGDMSVVGPRPPLPAEVEKYEFDARRRLLVKPGLTGLWQVSGRSGLSWEETVRLDLRYVENWSFAMDLMIVWKTVGAVLRGNGAY